MRKKSKLVYGIGINDADYPVRVQKFIGYNLEGKRVHETLWSCPFYQRWSCMIQRCYTEQSHKRFPSYTECYIVPEWHYFLNFKSWMENQEWENKYLDKDLLVRGNKVYGPETCVFVDLKVNAFLCESVAARGTWPIGVNFTKGKYRAQCKDIITDKSKHLGMFDTPEEAHQAWLAFKLEQAYILAAEQTDPRVAKALIDRYENYGKLD